uniref:Uncharacterized protein n=1 Tax=Picea glauca TaxID=3330 RepID=A0A101LVF3_PICGL|nr:hypothetical protein ABT39_MTgene2712 [Picea glauca]KUM46074.1 hypothetical protein ABT39_MTgene1880 [Picea glauca]KUM51039.1 hypothetical protein ABT39_MTgene885 [Picea glauca]QHR92522.1 hypothetical protein Q903MT_gene6568 [Picea sitchensis]
MTTGMRDEYVNPMADGVVRWQSILSFDTHSEDALQKWQDHNCMNYPLDIALRYG